MKTHKAGFFLVTLLLFFSNGVLLANVEFKIDATDYAIGVGDETTISIYARVVGGGAGNGIISWGLDLVPTVAGVVTVTGSNLLEPSPVEPFSASNGIMNLDPSDALFDGALLSIAASTLEITHDAGIGDFTKLAEVTVEGKATGDFTYNLQAWDTTGFYAYTADFTEYNIGNAGPYSIDFLSGNNDFTVTPEPCSLTILAILTGMVVRKRRMI